LGFSFRPAGLFLPQGRFSAIFLQAQTSNFNVGTIGKVVVMQPFWAVIGRI